MSKRQVFIRVNNKLWMYDKHYGGYKRPATWIRDKLKRLFKFTIRKKKG